MDGLWGYHQLPAKVWGGPADGAVCNVPAPPPPMLLILGALYRYVGAVEGVACYQLASTLSSAA